MKKLDKKEKVGKKVGKTAKKAMEKVQKVGKKVGKVEIKGKSKLEKKVVSVKPKEKKVVPVPKKEIKLEEKKVVPVPKKEIKLEEKKVVPVPKKEIKLEEKKAGNIAYMFFVLIGSYLEKNPERPKIVIEELVEYFNTDFSQRHKLFADRKIKKKDLQRHGRLLENLILGHGFVKQRDSKGIYFVKQVREIAFAKKKGKKKEKKKEEVNMKI
jgi:hypothetical protein